jgi:hypothetical protein
LKNKALIVFALMWNKDKQNYLTKAIDELQKISEVSFFSQKNLA